MPRFNPFNPPTLQADLSPFPEVLRLFVKRLKRERKRLGLSIDDIADKSGLSRNSICTLESGSQENPTFKTLCLYAMAVACRPTMGLRK